MNYYNDNDKFAVDWLKKLIRRGLIPEGKVDDRGIGDVRPEDLKGFEQCHFFAGIGGWPYALRLSNWSEDRPVWTGSCPCQPFSVAGKRNGEKDKRHLWPEFKRLIAECNPAVVFGEQVASKAGRLWLARVRSDLEEMGYAVGAADLPAGCVGAPHIRQRLWWVGNADGAGLQQRRKTAPTTGYRYPPDPASCLSESGRLADGKDSNRWSGKRREEERIGPEEKRRVGSPGGGIGNNGLADAGHTCGWEQEPVGQSQKRIAHRWDCARVCHPKSYGRQEMPSFAGCRSEGGPEKRAVKRPWRDSRYVSCIDGKQRRIPFEPALFPLADGLPGRVGLLRGAGNAIAPQLAAEFIAAFMDVEFLL